MPNYSSSVGIVGGGITGLIAGCTVHHIDEKLDNGRIIVKKKVWIHKKENSFSLKKKVQTEEYKAYSSAIRRIYNFI